MRPNLLLQLLSARPRSNRAAGYTMVAGILVILSLLVGTMGLLALVHGSKLAAFFSGEARDGQQVAEAGADQIIATFNQPENRQLLVAGSTPPNEWSTSNPALQSPCVSSDGTTRPGSNNGLPTQRAVNFGDGQFRDLQNVDSIVDVNAPDQAKRSFRLVSVRYSAGVSGNTDRRSIYRTFQANGTALSQAGDIPAGTSFNSLVNLDNPDGGDALNPGTNTGLITLTVEGRLYRADGTTTTFTTTKEFEVVPKCCGGSFGSNGSGGTTTATPPANSLGADNRNCGLDFGLIVGLNNGRMFSNMANDRFSRTNQAGEVVSINSILGLIAAPSHAWDRTTSLLVGNSQVGCRTIPSACNIASDTYPLGGSASLPNEYTTIRNATGGNSTPNNCTEANASGVPSQAYGNRSSVAGKAASCVPIWPLLLSAPGLPSIASGFTYTWENGKNPKTVSAQAVTSGNEGGYPIINMTTNDNAKIWLRANGATGVNQVTPGPFLEYCNTKYLPDNACASVFNGATIHSWAVISQSGDVTGGIRDDFESNSLSGRTANSTPRWPSIWVESDSDNANPALTTGDLQITNGSVTFQDVGSDFGTDYLLAPAIARAVNLYGLESPVLELVFRRTGSGNFNTSLIGLLRIDVSFDSDLGITTDADINTDTGWLQLAVIQANYVSWAINAPAAACGLSSGQIWICRIAFPERVYAASNRFRHYVKFRLRANSNFGTGTNRIDTFVLNSIAIKTAPVNYNVQLRYLNWCERSPSSHVAGVGFHCLGPTIDLAGPSNHLYIDSTDYPISFYYNNANDARGINFSQPLIKLSSSASILHVACSRVGGPTSIVPVENCSTPVTASAFNAVGAYGRLNFFGRDTAPANTCNDSGLVNQPCNQVIVIDSNSNSGNRSSLYGAWLYFPWGHLAFCGATCRASGWGQLPFTDFNADDSFNFFGRLWVRSLSSGGQAHLRIPASPSTSLSTLAGAINWTGIDWVARSTTATRQRYALN